jgi:hypothetical protein
MIRTNCRSIHDPGAGVTAERFAFQKILIRREEEIPAWQSLIEDDLFDKIDRQH